MNNTLNFLWLVEECCAITLGLETTLNILAIRIYIYIYIYNLLLLLSGEELSISCTNLTYCYFKITNKTNKIKPILYDLRFS